MKSPTQGAATSIHLASARLSSSGHRPILRQPPSQEIFWAEL
jgi:hypothetical protein